MLALRCGPVLQQRATSRQEEDLVPEEAAVRTRPAEQAARADKMAMAGTVERIPTDTRIVFLLLAIRMATTQMGPPPRRIIHHPIRRVIPPAIHPIHLRIIIRRPALRATRRIVLPIIRRIRHLTGRTVGRIARLHPMSATGWESAGGGRFAFDQATGMDIPMKRTA